VASVTVTEFAVSLSYSHLRLQFCCDSVHVQCFTVYSSTGNLASVSPAVYSGSCLVLFGFLMLHIILINLSTRPLSVQSTCSRSCLILLLRSRDNSDCTQLKAATVNTFIISACATVWSGVANIWFVSTLHNIFAACVIFYKIYDLRNF
jgi:hypothetical protein